MLFLPADKPPPLSRHSTSSPRVNLSPLLILHPMAPLIRTPLPSLPPAASNLTTIPTVVTGISGFIGSETALTALEQGNRVRGAVRRKEQGDAFFSRYPGISHDQLEFVVVEDITAEGAWDAAVVGVDFVVHTASPVGASDVMS